jgi:hypothetical protein
VRESICWKGPAQCGTWRGARSEVYKSYLETLQTEQHGDGGLGKGPAHAGRSLVMAFGHGSGSSGN